MERLNHINLGLLSLALITVGVLMACAEAALRRRRQHRRQP